MLKIRTLGKYGAVPDVDPYDLPPEAWSFAVNARFQNGRVVRAPVFRNVHALAQANPRFCTASLPTSGLDLLCIGYLNGRVYSFSSGAESNVSISGYADSTSELPYTSTHLADVFYINRGDRIPWYKRTSDSTFQPLANWNANWRAVLLRSCGSALVALNVTKSGVSSPTMIKTSSLPLAGNIPASWDETTPSTLATENILAEMEGAIIDAQSLGTNLYIYGLNETWQMSPGGQGVFNYVVTPFGKGAINANCAIEVGGKHYVFGVNDIWMHDGVSHVSIADQKTRQTIFSSINIKQANRCFVCHFPQRNELHFNYVSGDGNISFNGGVGCNRAAIFNYAEGTWTFDDLPFIFFGYLANLDNTLSYATVPSTYDTVGGTFLDQEDSFKRTLTMVGDVSSGYGLTASLYAFDQYGAGSSVAYPVDTNATKGMYLERTGIDLDEVNADLTGYKVITSIYPQARIGINAAPLQFSFGSADAFNQTPTYTDYQDYNGDDLNKLDFMNSGRYLAMRVSFNDYREVSISGLDLDVQITGER